MSWKIAIAIEEREGDQMSKLQQMIRDKGFEPVFYGIIDNEAELIEKLRDCEAVIAGGEVYNENVLRTLHNEGKLKVIARFGVGYDKVNLEAASRWGIAVTNTCGTMAEPVAEMVMSLLLATARCVPFCDRTLREGKWITDPVGASLAEKTVGLVGFGSIAKKIVEYLSGFHCRILAADICFDEQAAKAMGVKEVSIEQLAEESDFVSINTPKTSKTIHLWDRKMFEKMKPTAILINTSRGEIVNQEDLVWALKNKIIAGAGLDVFEEEPLPKDSPLLQLDQVVMTPHIAGWNDQTEVVTGGRTLDNIYDVSGEFFIDEKPVKIDGVRDAMSYGISLLSEDRHESGLFLQDKTVKYNLTASILMQLKDRMFLSKKRVAGAADKMMKELQIKADGVDSRVTSLSGGNQQKVVLGRCILVKPDILLLDEPTRGVDVGTKNQIYHLIYELADSGISIIVISSELPELVNICDRFLVIASGEIKGELSCEEVSEELIMRYAVQ